MVQLRWRRIGAAVVGFSLAAGVAAAASPSAGATPVPAKSASPTVNLALGKPTASVGDNPSAAVDGNVQTATAQICCYSGWWQVDLTASETIQNIDITNGLRQSDWPDNGSNGDYYVFVSSKPFDHTLSAAQQAKQPGVWSSHQTDTSPAVHKRQIALPAGQAGRYVMIQQDAGSTFNSQNNIGYLVLSEVAVNGAPATAPSDLALHQPASQSGTYPWKPFSPAAGLAVDGNTDGNFYDRSVSYTTGKGADWWQVDLGAAKAVYSINVFNRTDWGSDRLGNYWVFVSNTPFNTSLTPAQQATQPGVWSSHQTTTPSPSSSIPAGVTGRYVMVQQNATQYLTLAEVQVLGDPYQAPTDVALHKATSTSSPSCGDDGAPGVDGIRNTVTITCPVGAAGAWWRVDLGASTPIHEINVVPADFAVGDYVVFVSNTPLDPNASISAHLAQHPVWSSRESDYMTSYHDHNIVLPAGVSGRYILIQQDESTAASKAAGIRFLDLGEVIVH